jgi:hypothetical protein
MTFFIVTAVKTSNVTNSIRYCSVTLVYADPLLGNESDMNDCTEQPQMCSGPATKMVSTAEAALEQRNGVFSAVCTEAL